MGLQFPITYSLFFTLILNSSLKMELFMFLFFSKKLLDLLKIFKYHFILKSIYKSV